MIYGLFLTYHLLQFLLYITRHLRSQQRLETRHLLDADIQLPRVQVTGQVGLETDVQDQLIVQPAHQYEEAALTERAIPGR